MIEKINNFNDTYNISINIVNDILYLDIQNYIKNTKFNLIINDVNLKEININNIKILHFYLFKCFIKEKNFNISFYEHSNELIIEVIFIDDDYTENFFKLYLKYYNDYNEKIIENDNICDLLKKYEINNDNDDDNNNNNNDNDNNYISKEYIPSLYNYFYNILYILKIFCIDDDRDY